MSFAFAAAKASAAAKQRHPSVKLLANGAIDHRRCIKYTFTVADSTFTGIDAMSKDDVVGFRMIGMHPPAGFDRNAAARAVASFSNMIDGLDGVTGIIPGAFRRGRDADVTNFLTTDPTLEQQGTVDARLLGPYLISLGCRAARINVYADGASMTNHYDSHNHGSPWLFAKAFLKRAHSPSRALAPRVYPRPAS